MELVNQIDETISFNNNNIRIIGSSNEPWFVAKDICNILDLKDVSNALLNISEKWKGTKVISTLGGEQNMRIINEAGLYKLIMRSNKPIAQKFQEVVCEEILPSLRKKGEYHIQSIIDKNKELEEEKLRLEEENKLYSNRILKKNKRKYKIGECVYVVMSEHIKDEFKVGQTDDIHKRLKTFNNASPTRFILHKIWYTRFNKPLERLVQDIFQKYRISLNNEWFKMECLEKIVEWVDIFIKSVEKFDTKEVAPIPEPNLIFIDNNRTDKKKCSKCLLAKPLYEFYISDQNLKEEDFDLTNEEENEIFKVKKYRSSCKQCCNGDSKEHRNKIKEDQYQYYNRKECVECKNILTFDNFYRMENKNLYENCIQCYNQQNSLVNSKQCSECNLILDTENFGIHTGNLLRTQCKECRNKKIVLKKEDNEDEISCEFCNKKIKYKSNLSIHQKTKACLKAQGKIESSEKSKPLVNIRSKIVAQYDIATQTEIKRYTSIAEAEKETNINRTNIEKCCKGKNKTAGGYIFKFIS